MAISIRARTRPAPFPVCPAEPVLARLSGPSAHMRSARESTDQATWGSSEGIAARSFSYCRRPNVSKPYHVFAADRADAKVTRNQITVNRGHLSSGTKRRCCSLQSLSGHRGSGARNLGGHGRALVAEGRSPFRRRRRCATRSAPETACRPAGSPPADRRRHTPSTPRSPDSRRR